MNNYEQLIFLALQHGRELFASTNIRKKATES